MHCAHQKITRVYICRLSQHIMSYKAYMTYHLFGKLADYVMLFKAYPTYLCS